MQIPDAFVSEYPKTCSDPDKGQEDAVGMPGSGPRTLSRDGKLKAGQFLPGSSSSLPDPRNGASSSLRQPRTETQVMAVEMSIHQKLACRKQKKDLRM